MPFCSFIGFELLMIKDLQNFVIPGIIAIAVVLLARVIYMGAYTVYVFQKPI
jgi:CPA1 family monovalent cation:H+ antiporter